MERGDRARIFDTEATLAAALLSAVEDTEFPQYGFGVVQAAALAAQLQILAVTVVELGVAGGNGLVRLQRLARDYAPAGIRVDVHGFDLGAGMPTPADFRDMPYIWQRGFFDMDERTLRSRLVEARLHIGDIAETGPRFLASEPAPIGFISFDLDYYSSTIAAMAALLDGAPERYLPRVVCSFDDTVGPHHEMHSQFTGELLAIEEFNATNEHRKLATIRGLRYKLAPHDGAWIPGMHVLHVFDHPRYNDYIYPVKSRQFPLTETET